MELVCRRTTCRWEIFLYGARRRVFIFMGGVMDDSQTLIRVTPDWDVAEYPLGTWFPVRVPARGVLFTTGGDYIALKTMRVTAGVREGYETEQTA